MTRFLILALLLLFPCTAIAANGDTLTWDNTQSNGTRYTAPSMGGMYLGSTLKTSAKFIAKTATVAGGAGHALFYLTDNGASNGVALCTNVWEETLRFELNSTTFFYRPAWTISGDKKTLDVSLVSSTSSGNIVLLSLSLLSAPVAAANGTVVYMSVMCE